MAGLKRNIAYNFAYQLLILALPLVTAPYLARVIGPAGVGTYSYSLATATYFTYFVKLGLDNYGNRTIAACGGDRDRVTRVFWSIYAMQAACFAASGSAYLAYCLLLAQDRTAALLQGLFVLSSLLDVNWLFFGLEQFGLTVARNTLVKLTTTALVFLLVKSPQDIYSYVGIMAGGFLASQAALWPFLPRYVGRHRPTISEVLPHIRPNLVLFVSVIAISVYNTLSRVMLGAIAGPEQVGFFESAAKLVSVPTALVGAVGTVMLPRASALVSAGDEEGASAHIDATMLGVLAFAGVASFGIAAVAAPFTEAFYGPGYAVAADCLVVLCATVPLLAFGNVMRTQYLIPHGLDYVFLGSAMCGAIASVVVNLATIPLLGAVGSAFASVAAEASVLAYQLAKMGRDFPSARYLAWAGGFLACGAAMHALLRLVPTPMDPLARTAALVGAGLVIYGTLAAPLVLLMRRSRSRHG